MQLEHIEELCINYLEQTKNPLTPLETLYQFCKRDERSAALTQHELFNFLRDHSRIVMLFGPDENEEVTEETLRANGILLGPRVILKERIPTEGHLMQLFRAQLDDMEEKLHAALTGLKGKQSAQAQAFETALERIARLRESIKKLDQR